MVISASCKTYVDDLRSIAETQSFSKEANHQVETTMWNIGLQDATSMWRPISQTPGKWTGSITLLLESVGLFVKIS